jgi:two-component system response regulator DevR
MKVFLVEDSPIIRERLAALLSSIDQVETVGEAAGADEAVRGILDTRPDTVVLDIQLEQGTGFDVLRRLREESRNIDVMMLTNHPTAPYRRAAERLGVRYIFDKTTEFERVRDIIAARAASSQNKKPEEAFS